MSDNKKKSVDTSEEFAIAFGDIIVELANENPELPEDEKIDFSLSKLQ